MKHGYHTSFGFVGEVNGRKMLFATEDEFVDYKKGAAERDARKPELQSEITNQMPEAV